MLHWNRHTDRVYMLEHNYVMNVSNKDWIHVNRFISALPKGSSQERISEVDSIAGLEPVIVGHLPACVLDRMVLLGVCILRMLENFGRGFHPEVEGDDIINSSVVVHLYTVKNSQNVRYCCLVKLLVRRRCLYAAR